MQSFCSLTKTVALIALVFGVSALHAQNGLSDGVVSVGCACESGSALLGVSFVTADFNNDHYPDDALLMREKNTFRIEVHVRFHGVRAIKFSSSLTRLSISALDVNRDGVPDLIVEEPFSHRRVFVWINDGYGYFHAGNVEDFQTDSGWNSRRAGSPWHEREYVAIAMPCKMRARCASLSPECLGVPTSIVQFVGELDDGLPASGATANRLRGPPSLIFL